MFGIYSPLRLIRVLCQLIDNTVNRIGQMFGIRYRKILRFLRLQSNFIQRERNFCKYC